jgi:hypothetical protein
MMTRRVFRKGIAVVGAPRSGERRAPSSNEPKAAEVDAAGVLVGIAIVPSHAKYLLTNTNVHDEHGCGHHQAGIGAHDHSGARFGRPWAPTAPRSPKGPAHEPVLVLQLSLR